MIRTLTLFIVGLLVSTVALSQTSDLVFFADDGSKFTLLVDGDVKNESPAGRVIATGIRNESPVIIIRFEDPSIPQIRKSGFYEMGKEYTIMVTTNKKGERTLRLTGQAELGTAAKAAPAVARPVDFVDDPASSRTTTTAPLTLAEDDEQVTTVTTVKETSGSTGGENVQINMGVNGVNLNMGVNIDDDMDGGSMTTTTTTTTTTRTSSTNSAAATKPSTPVAVKETEVYRMPGYSGPVGCAMPMGGSEFTEAKKGVEAQGFEDTRLTMAKQIGRDRCFSSDQVRSMMGAFSFEDTRLEFAKFAYDRTHDLGNYYKVNEAFSFSSSVDELNEYVGSR